MPPDVLGTGLTEWLHPPGHRVGRRATSQSAAQTSGDARAGACLGKEPGAGVLGRPLVGTAPCPAVALRTPSRQCHQSHGVFTGWACLGTSVTKHTKGASLQRQSPEFAQYLNTLDNLNHPPHCFTSKAQQRPACDSCPHSVAPARLGHPARYSQRRSAGCCSLSERPSPPSRRSPSPSGTRRPAGEPGPQCQPGRGSTPQGPQCLPGRGGTPQGPQCQPGRGSTPQGQHSVMGTWVTSTTGGVAFANTQDGLLTALLGLPEHPSLRPGRPCGLDRTGSHPTGLAGSLAGSLAPGGQC